MTQWVWVISGAYLDKEVETNVPALTISNIFGFRSEQEQQSNPHRENASVVELCTQLIQEPQSRLQKMWAVGNFSITAKTCKANEY